jgi:uncharacterized RDD family membrane protein YckC
MADGDPPERNDESTALPLPPGVPARLAGLGARGAERLAGATGIDEALERAAEEAIVRALESAAVERGVVRVLEGPAADAALERALRSPELERALARVLDSELVDHIWERLLASNEAQRLVERIAEAPEVRQALAAQGVGLIADVGRQVRDIGGRLDAVLERIARRVIRRPPPAAPTPRIGIVTRGLAAAADAAILNGIMLGLAALLGIVISSVFDAKGASTSAIALGAGAWLVATATYLLLFWSLAGQTPGMRFLSIRIEHAGSPRLGLRRALRRLEGGVLSVLTLGLGFLRVVVADDGRSLQDRMAGTDVVRVDAVAPWSAVTREAVPSAAWRMPSGPSGR